MTELTKPLPSAAYWENRYANGGNSGAGSYNRLATFKADFLNAFVERHVIHSVIEFGSGDGAQLELARYPCYKGIDVSTTAVAMAAQRFRTDVSKSFSLLSEHDGNTADLALSLDVIFHLIEDDVYERYMTALFRSATRFVIIYASNIDAPGPAPHVRHRRFTDWIAKKAPEWPLFMTRPNDFPFHESDPDHTSFSDFYVFSRR